MVVHSHLFLVKFFVVYFIVISFYFFSSEQTSGSEVQEIACVEPPQVSNTKTRLRSKKARLASYINDFSKSFAILIVIRD